MSAHWGTAQPNPGAGLLNTNPESRLSALPPEPCSTDETNSFPAASGIRLVVHRSGWVLFAVLIAVGIRDMGLWEGVAGALLVIVSLAMHELGHIATARALHVPVHEAGLKFIGAYTRRKPAARRLHELAIAAAGPFTSVLLFFVLFFVPGIGPWLSAWNLGIVVVNLVPCPGTDGYRILKTIFSRSPLQSRNPLIKADVQRAQCEPQANLQQTLPCDCA